MAKQKQVHRVPIKTARWLIAIVAVICAIMTIRTHRTIAQKQALLEENRQKIERRSKDIKRTGHDIRHSDGLDFVEKVAREDLGMVKPREVIYIDKNKDREGDLNKEDIN
ncbi:MAG: septum formation initiator family protein [Peptoniphilus sp.]|nr:septum formation initiator family protein [Peptoniphilus sp.]MDD7362787.1 septum formation initiator family protein [Bacillota bacterium]MDY6044021.1 septum formation initiator family protein [Peptoniphilus sp.]